MAHRCASLALVAEAPLTVELRGVVKRYPVFRRRRQRLQLLCGLTRGLNFVPALDGVDLRAAAGEAVGIIGENGSGKTTLLRVVAGVSEVDGGEVRVAQPVAAILELGLGFHSNLTARENLELFGASIGVPAHAMRPLIPDILAFAELEEYADQALYSFSSGMAARLAFAAATAVDPQVLVVDEALAVGDGAFQRKCIARMVHFRDRGRTVLFSSHAMYQVAEFCSRAVWLRQGRVAAEGPAAEVIHGYEAYLRHLQRGQESVVTGTLWPQAAWLDKVTVEPLAPHAPGQKLDVRIVVRRVEPHFPVHLGVGLKSADGVGLAFVSTAWDELDALRGDVREEVVLEVSELPAASGVWDLNVYLADEYGLNVLDVKTVPGAVQVLPRRWNPGLVMLSHRWR